MTNKIIPLRPEYADALPKEHPVCENCHLIHWGKWQKGNPADPQDTASYLKACSRPTFTTGGIGSWTRIKSCCICSGPTVVGIVVIGDHVALNCGGFHAPDEQEPEE